MMIISLKQFIYFFIYVVDDKVGGICDIFFDDEIFIVCYLVVDINIWFLFSCKVVIFFIFVIGLEVEEEFI